MRNQFIFAWKLDISTADASLMKFSVRSVTPTSLVMKTPAKVEMMNIHRMVFATFAFLKMMAPRRKARAYWPHISHIIAGKLTLKPDSAMPATTPLNQPVMEMYPGSRLRSRSLTTRRAPSQTGAMTNTIRNIERNFSKVEAGIIIQLLPAFLSVREPYSLMPRMMLEIT